MVRFSGASLRQQRRRAGLTIDELAAVTGVSESSISRWERGVGAPRAAHLGQLATALGVTTADLCSTGARDLAEVRMLAGFSRHAAAAVAGLSETTLARYERASSPVSELALAALSDTYGVDVDELAAAAAETLRKRQAKAGARRAARTSE